MGISSRWSMFALKINIHLYWYYHITDCTTPGELFKWFGAVSNTTTLLPKRCTCGSTLFHYQDLNINSLNVCHIIVNYSSKNLVFSNQTTPYWYFSSLSWSSCHLFTRHCTIFAIPSWYCKYWLPKVHSWEWRR